MKKTLLLLFVCLFGALNGAKAYTTTDLTTAGWTQVTAISNDANNENYVGNFVYVLVDAGSGSSTYVMSGQTTKHRWYDWYTPAYRTLSDPFTTPYEVWTLESRSDGYAMRNIVSQEYYNSNYEGGSGEGWKAGMASTYTTGSFTFNLADGKYSINGVSSGGRVGPFNDGGSVSAEGEEIVANKSAEQAPGFYIYKMAKATYARKYIQAYPNLTAPVDLSFLIVNPTIYQAHNKNQMPDGWSEYDVDSEDRTEGTGNTKFKGWDNSVYKTLKLDYFQTIANLPGGLYNITAATRDNNNHGKLKVYIYHSASDRRAQSDAATSTENDHTTSDLALDGGSTVNTGIRTDGNSENSTVTGDNFRMHVNPYLSTMATELPANGAMTAGLWYHFTVANSYKYALSSTNLNNIIYATGSTTALSAAGSDKFSATQNLTAGTDYYVRSTTDNTLTMTPCISSVATELSNGGAMTVGNWYYFDIALGGNYDFIAASLSDIVYTTNGDAAQDASIEDHFAAKNNALSKTSYYVKSASNQTLTWTYSDNTDLTDLIINPSFETDEDGHVGATGWTLEDTKNDTKVHLNSNSTYTMTLVDGEKLFNTWDGDSRGYTISQTISNLPAGVYKVTAVMGAFADQTLQLIANDVTGEAPSVDKGTGVLVTTYVTLASPGDLTIQAKTKANGFYKDDDFHLTYLGDASANLKVNNGKLGTFIAPFAITLPENVKAYSATSSETQVTLTKIAEAGDELAAGTPVIVYGDGADVNTNFYGKSTVATNKTVGALTGILNNSDMTISSGKYVLQTQGGNQAFYKLDGDATGALNRCYVTANVGAEARLVISYEDDDPMAINAIEATDAKAEGLKDGKYLVKGKIVLVKNGLKFNANGQILK